MMRMTEASGNILSKRDCQTSTRQKMVKHSRSKAEDTALPRGG